MRHFLLPLWLFCFLVVSCDSETPLASASQQPPLATGAQALALTATWYPSPLSIPGCFDGFTSDCRSGSLLVGRGRVGFEPHAPNTVNGTCPDGDSGTFHANGSVDAIRIHTPDGELLREGRPVSVDVSVWGGAEPGELRLYHAGDSHSPTWVEMGSASVVPGAQVVSFSFVLPQGVPQHDMPAVRAALRSPGSAEPCVPGDFHDHDDLAFLVARPPRIHVRSPVEGATVSGPVTLEVYVADRSERISFLEFRRGTAVLSTSPASANPDAPYTFTWNSLEVADGTYELSFRAVYGQGSETIESVGVNVVNGRVPPVVSITTPASGATVQGQVSISAELRDDAGLSWWAVIVDGQWLCVEEAYGTSASVTCSWSTLGLENGGHVIEVRAHDGMGLQSTASTMVQVDNERVPPTVSVSAPAEGALLSGTVGLEALASDDSGIARVSFHVESASGSRSLGEDSVAPYSVPWDTRAVPNGTYRITARAIDRMRNQAASLAVTVTVDNGLVPPTVSLSQPGPGSTLSGTVQLQALASDNVGIARVGFYLGETLLGSTAERTASSSYQLAWNTRLFPNGSQTLTARAVDLEGAESTSAPVTVTLNNDLTPPTVALTSPANGVTLTGPVTLLASATDDRGVASVEFCSSTRCLGQDTTAPYSLAVRAGDIPNGAQVLTARAYDAAGNRTTSTPVEVLIDNEFIPPTLSITSPVEGALVDGTVSIQLAASDNVAITRVECAHASGVSIGSDSSAPYVIGWSTASLLDDATYTLHCKAYDPTGNTAAATRSVKVHRNRVPTVSFLEPLAGSTVSGTVKLRVRAEDDYGIAQVEYFDTNGFHLGTSTTAPSYEWVWDSSRHLDGTFTLKARAIDVKGVMSETSRAVTISNPPTVSFYSPAEGAVLKGTVTLTAVASDSNGISRVEFYAGSVRVGTDTAAPYSLSWESRSLPNGGVRLLAKAIDTLGNAATATVNVTLENDLTPPTVSVTSPAGGSVLTGTVTLAAEASDASGISKVELYDGSWLVGTDTASPYEVSWSTRASSQPNGTHLLVAKAYDSAGNVATSAPVEVTLDNDVAAPTVSITSPAEGSEVSGVVPLGVEASDERGVTRVIFYRGTNPYEQLGIDTTAPYSLDWNSLTVADGPVTFTVYAQDAAGNAGRTQVTVNVHNDRAGPTVSLSWPGAAAGLRGTVQLDATASDDVKVERVEFYAGTTLLGTTSQWVIWNGVPRYSITWNTLSLPEGVYPLTAKAYDLYGKTATSEEVEVTVDNTVPTVALGSPAAGATLEGTVTLTAEATDNRGISRVEFFVNGLLVGTDTSAPYSVAWDSRTVTNGTVGLSVRVHDVAGNQGSSTPVNVSVSNDFTAPTVRLTAPTAGATVSRTVTLSATASDDRAVTRVEFYVGSILVGTDTSAPYSVTWDSSGFPNGAYTLTPKAYDAAGNVGTGAGAAVTLKNPKG